MALSWLFTNMKIGEALSHLEYTFPAEVKQSSALPPALLKCNFCSLLSVTLFCVFIFLLVMLLLNIGPRDFPGSPVVKTQCFHCRSLVPVWGAKFPHTIQHGQKEIKNGPKCSAEVLSYISKCKLIVMHFMEKIFEVPLRHELQGCWS